MIYAAFRSIGAYIPPKIMSNADFEKIIDTSDEWITKRTGIKERRIANEGEASSDLGARAGELAIERAAISKEEIDLVICATVTPDFLCMPSTACLIAAKLGLSNVMAFDVSAACTGFVYALNVAKAFIESGMKKNVLIVGAEKYSAILDYTDRTTCFLFGDGAGAAIISATNDKSESIIDINCSSDGNYEDLIKTPGGGSKNPCSQEVLENKMACIKMKGNETFKLAVKTLTSDVKTMLEKHNLTNEDINHFIPHQANYRIIKAVGEALDLSDEKTVVTVDKYGNTSAASIPMAMNYAFEQGKIKAGDTILFDAFGGGLTWGSALFKFAPIKR
ncbi:3-oxoacyl-(acyl carrier protein) synthase III [Aliarcobacter butzleri RM4018]|uniref:Beta-ketoacyl-[acyl-carrier-protein] synthase III n=2 Tax=Aliarcobacter butzleri TaxID=28197 RepID=FABH_ALIB4|nr:beta-ketoacyl-ACP synthase III [Aliarcobacter butzleri]A8ERJ6.1 RecName: Full=Beta-ketoacyl-[acyl-carrier-protein] synthase III; Short=Beta-ketoacyl-ACP synthase III; Short=KAS III; AltName: Full=3-oxoacyl-[acyl-carrier-protein] synthase 3; AltName: Full=3-oxoacyl-[acyl-carrier-protein] synthase III [Aliarcobacter butzleri RM4018]ABV66570.1 3-oxoacyl-(acyl carrier protein) synthase III [Aliarcobacter butzleri RM4018]GGT70732.1 3-oxoacyl-[acyl-carrier-protein] synthase 3 [Aliarcobacter butzler